jgi:pimeloyl-ACP methyl ester carboxylesterase
MSHLGHQPGARPNETHETDTFYARHAIEGGIERVVYTPKHRRFDTPILMQHGMWHGAWCWRHWQESLATWGWESHAFSLPGHAGSPTQRPVYFCTLGYYLRFLMAEVERLPRKPVLMGHSMGGALTQWYLKHVDDSLPAAVLVASWAAKGNIPDDGGAPWRRLDPLGLLLVALTGSARFFIRTPKHAAAILISPRAIYTPEELHARLSPESAWVMYQHNPPVWQPPAQVRAPLLLMAGEMDAVLPVANVRRSAAHYGADCVVVPDAGHNLMMEHNYRETAETIHNWLSDRGVM